MHACIHSMLHLCTCRHFASSFDPVDSTLSPFCLPPTMEPPSQPSALQHIAPLWTTTTPPVTVEYEGWHVFSISMKRIQFSTGWGFSVKRVWHKDGEEKRSYYDVMKIEPKCFAEVFHDPVEMQCFADMSFSVKWIPRWSFIPKQENDSEASSKPSAKDSPKSEEPSPMHDDDDNSDNVKPLLNMMGSLRVARGADARSKPY